jgi:hypothetical protein
VLRSSKTQPLSCPRKDPWHQEELKCVTALPAQTLPPNLDILRVAAKALAAKQKLADAAATNAQAVNRAIIDHAAPKADFPSSFSLPITPFFANPDLRKHAGDAHDAWWKRNKRTLCATAIKTGLKPAPLDEAIRDLAKRLEQWRGPLP